MYFLFFDNYCLHIITKSADHSACDTLQGRWMEINIEQPWRKPGRVKRRPFRKGQQPEHWQAYSSFIMSKPKIDWESVRRIINCCTPYSLAERDLLWKGEWTYISIVQTTLSCINSGLLGRVQIHTTLLKFLFVKILWKAGKFFPLSQSYKITIKFIKDFEIRKISSGGDPSARHDTFMTLAFIVLLNTWIGKCGEDDFGML